MGQGPSVSSAVPEMNARLQELRRKIEALEKLEAPAVPPVAELEVELAQLQARRAHLEKVLAAVRATMAPAPEAEAAPFACPFCVRTYAAKPSLVRHMRAKHPKVSFGRK